MKKAKTLEDMLNVFSPVSSIDENFDEFYVETSKARGDNAAKKLALRFNNADQTKKILFLGHTGSGKSTELFKVQNDLMEKYVIINFSIGKETDTVDLNYIDLIFVMLNNIVKKTLDSNYKLKSDKLKNIIEYWSQEKILNIVEKSCIDVSSEVGIATGLEWLGGLLAKVRGIFQTGVETKQEIRQVIEPTLKQLMININELIDDVEQTIAPKKLLLIVEDLDKIEISQAKDLFIEHRKTLTSLKINAIYTFPIYLFYSPYYNEILADFDADVLLSMIKVNEMSGVRFACGIDTIKEIVTRRCEASLIADDALEFMVLKSGGALRDLFYMIENAALNVLVEEKNNAIINICDAEKVYDLLKSRKERMIKKVHLPILKEVYNDKTKKPFGDDNDYLMELLQSLSIIEYNGKRWCGLHPAIKDYLLDKGELNGLQK